MKPIITTERLVLRQWLESDKPLLTEMNKDPVVMEFFPELWSESRSMFFFDAFFAKIEKQGFGFWAVEERATGDFIGFVGLNDHIHDLPINHSHEVGWRLRPNCWGKGYATEAAKGSLDYAFGQLNLQTVVAFTPIKNLRSRKVMEKLGMVEQDDTFLHPKVSAESGLQEHVLYVATA